MMKKNIFAVAFLVGMGVAAGAGAADVGQSTGFQSSSKVTQANCKLLASDVTLNLSSKVWGSYKCDETTSVIQVSACHEGGSRASTTVPCAESPAGSGNYLPAGCTATTPTIAIADYSGFVAGSNGGSVAQGVLGGNCTGTSVTKLLK